MGEYFPDLPSRTLGQMGSVDYNPVKLTAESLYSKWAVGYLWGRSNGTSGEHPKGLALDFSVLEYRTPTVGGPARMWMGDAIARFLWTHRKRLGVWYIIWNRRIISTNRHSYAYNGWVAYRGSNPHTDHVHVSFYAANVYQPPAPPEPDKDWFDMADPKDLREVVDAALDAKLGPAVKKGIDEMRQPIAGRVLNTNFPTGVKHLDEQGGRNIPWFLRDLRNKTYATAEAVEKLARAEVERAAVGSAEREALSAAVADLRAALDDEPDDGTVPEDEEEPKESEA